MDAISPKAKQRLRNSVQKATAKPAHKPTRSALDAEIKAFHAKVMERFGHIKIENVTKTINDPARNKSYTATVPASFSDQAAQIIITKYMRRAGVPPETELAKAKPGEQHIPEMFRPRVAKKGITKADLIGENDAEQVFHRLAGAWTYWGMKKAAPGELPLLSVESAPLFYEAMKTLMRVQAFAPNSPQWFNTGLHWAYGIEGKSGGHFHISPSGDIAESESAYENPQAHACFINSVADDLVNPGGIMDLWMREARIFQQGSGSGANYSNIRAANERLSGGGLSSGMMSFLKIGDVGAGSIKSGGVTRRAARMVIVNDNHPDVEEFINWKSKEERKVAALVTGSIINREHCIAIHAAVTNNSNINETLAAAKKAHLPDGLIAQTIQRAKEGLPVQQEIYDIDWQGEAYQTVGGQNANNSVRLSNAFMEAVEDDAEWALTRRTDGSVAKVVSARALWRLIAENSWSSADPGLQFHDTINSWHTSPNAGPINASNPCSEYMFLDDTGCNLASINLVKFLNEDGSFDVEAFAATSGLMAMTLDITVTMGQYPSREIAEKTRDFRTLGGGFANIGGLLMRMGIPYDSDRGRAIGATCMSIITGAGYRISGIMAEAISAFPGYAKNAIPTKNVVKRHASAHANLMFKTTGMFEHDRAPVPEYIALANGLLMHGQDVADALWNEALKSPAGYRNAQISVIAPTGTIGILMDCDTTGIEPDFSIVKFKSLAGGGSMIFMNNTAEQALTRLKYAPDRIARIKDYIAQYQGLDGCADIDEKDRAIFDCANPCGPLGKRYIAPMGHVDMMAAVQPFVSGAISKTVNMPESSTVDEIMDIHMAAFKKGIKAIAIYRDRSKLSQPLSTELLKAVGADDVKMTEAVMTNDIVAVARELAATEMRSRRRLPAKRKGHTQKADIGEHRVFLTTGEYNDGTLGEIFIAMHKEGAAFRSLMNAFAIAISLGLQHGVPLERFVDAYIFTRFEPAGMVREHESIKSATSIVDYIFRHLAINYLGRYDLAHIKPEAETHSTDVGHGVAEGRSFEMTEDLEALIEAEQASMTEKGEISRSDHYRQMGFTGNQCTNCGSMKMVRTGTCETCQECTSTSGGCS